MVECCLRNLAHVLKKPVIRGAIETSIIMGTGDLIAQKILEKAEVLDKKRLLVFSGTGLLFVGPICTKWLYTLDRIVPKTMAPVPRTFTKMLLDQAFVAPTMLASVLTILTLALETRTWEAVKDKLDDKFIDILLMNYRVWPAVQLLNFRFVPVQYQLRVIQIGGVLWNTYLSDKVQRSA